MGDFEDSLIAFPAIQRLRALVPGGFGAVAKGVRRALEDEDYSTALREANARYARRGVEDYVAGLTYSCLLVGRELVVEARGLLDKAIERHGRKPALIALLADALVLEGDVERAKRELATLDPHTLEAAKVAGFVADVHLDLGNEDEAIAFYQRAIDLGVDDPEPAIRVGQLYLGRDELREAAEAYEYAARLAKRRIGLWQATADMWFELGETFRGYQARRRVLELGDADADEWLELGWGLAEFGSFDDALDALAKAEHLDPFALEPLLIRGHVMLAMGRAEEALAAFGAVEAKQNAHPTAQRGLAEAALLIGDVTLAEEKAARAVELSPDAPEAHYVLGRALQQFGRHEKALEAFRSALVLDDAQAEYAVGLALTLANLGRIEEAKASLQTAIDLHDQSEQMPLWIDEAAWQRLKARLDEADRADIDAKLEALGEGR